MEAKTTAIYLTDAEIEDFKQYRKHKAEIEATRIKEQNWQDLIKFAKGLQYGVFTLTIKDGLPVRVDNPMQTLVFGIKI